MIHGIIAVGGLYLILGIEVAMGVAERVISLF